MVACGNAPDTFSSPASQAPIDTESRGEAVAASPDENEDILPAPTEESTERRPAPPPPWPGSLGEVHTTSRPSGSWHSTTTLCPGVLVASDAVLLPAHCFDWHRNKNKQVHGQSEFTLGDESYDVGHIVLHPDYRFVACDPRFGEEHQVECTFAMAKCLALGHQRNLCARQAALVVRATQGGAPNDAAILFLRRHVPNAQPISVATTWAANGPLQVALPPGSHATNGSWTPAHADILGHTQHSIALRSPDTGYFGTAALSSTPQGWTLAAMGSYIADPLAATAARRDYMYTRPDTLEPWVCSMLGARCY